MDHFRTYCIFLKPETVTNITVGYPNNHRPSQRMSWDTEIQIVTRTGLPEIKETTQTTTRLPFGSVTLPDPGTFLPHLWENYFRPIRGGEDKELFNPFVPRPGRP